jgi:uncharacterized protein
MKKSLILISFFFSAIVFAQEYKNPIPQISVSGEGKVKVKPDQAEFVIGVQNSGKDAAEVKNLNDVVIDKVIKFLKKSGIPATDYKTNNVSLHKNYDYEKKRYFFLANQSLTIKLKDLSKYDALMMGLNDTGINSIQGVEFKSSMMEEHEKEARKLAMLNAKQKANDYVSVLNQKIGKAIIINDNSQTNYPQPIYKNMAMAMEADSSVSRETLAIGEIVITANVNVSFILE